MAAAEVKNNSVCHQEKSNAGADRATPPAAERLLLVSCNTEDHPVDQQYDKCDGTGKQDAQPERIRFSRPLVFEKIH